MANSQFNQSNESKDDAMPTYLPPGVANIALSYLDGDINSCWSGDKETKKFSETERQQFRLFGRPYQELISVQAAEVATLILCGEEKEATQALDLITKNPNLLHCSVTVKDLLGRTVRGTPLQIAAMAGDVNLKEGITEEKDMGLVERLIKIGNLSKEEVAEQLQVITSDEAKQENAKRNERVQKALEKLGNSIIESKKIPAKYDRALIKEIQTLCQSSIDEFEAALAPDPNEIITSGFIFDLNILSIAEKWFDNNLDHRFDGYGSNKSWVFMINGYGKLQTKLSSRDAQITHSGMGNLIGNNRIPARKLKNPDGTSCFFNLRYAPEKRLGRDFYYAGYDAHPPYAWQATDRYVKALISRKNDSIAKLLPKPSNDLVM